MSAVVTPLAIGESVNLLGNIDIAPVIGASIV
jgi:hypothetical protein